MCSVIGLNSDRHGSEHQSLYGAPCSAVLAHEHLPPEIKCPLKTSSVFKDVSLHGHSGSLPLRTWRLPVLPCCWYPQSCGPGTWSNHHGVCLSPIPNHHMLVYPRQVHCHGLSVALCLTPALVAPSNLRHPLVQL